MWSLPSKTLVIQPIGHIKSGSSLTIKMSSMVHLVFFCREVKALIFRLSDVFLTRVEIGIAVNGRPMRKCLGVRASASLTSLDGVTSGLEMSMASIFIRTAKN